MAESIRPMALALIWRGQEILVEEGRDEIKRETFFRLLGGGIEFGEKGADALQRELREELGVETDVERYLTTVENVFTYEGEPGHGCMHVDSFVSGSEILYPDGVVALGVSRNQSGQAATSPSD